jgi:tetratricopeptide (TPR) repeat protein
MDYRQFMKLMGPGESSGENSVPVLQEFVNEFPYFQSAQVLLAKSMHEQQHVRYERQLKIAAAYAGDRKILYNLIHSKGEKIISGRSIIREPEIISAPVEKIVESENIFRQPEENYIVPPFDDEIESDSHTENISEHITPVFFYKEPVELIEEPEEIKENIIADPHDIIRNRLKEILGLKKEEEEISIHDLPESKVETKVSDEVISDERSNPKEKDEVIISQESDQAESNIDSEDSAKSKNLIDLAQMETALESTLIQSLERLPLIEKTVPSEKTNTFESSANAHSFLDWLKIKSSPEYGKIEEVHADDIKEIPAVDHSEVTSDETPIEKTQEKSSDISKLIDRFLETDPKIVPSKKEFYSPANQAKKSVTENEDLVSETLAKIYFQQGNFQKAISSYQRLSLLYPEKMAYFAALISEVEKAINNQDKQDL